jgi:hypothetical protein
VASTRAPEGSPWPARVVALVVALVVAGPALGSGFVLLRDMVFVPRQDVDLDALGLGGALPRAVPVDAVMGLLTTLIPGALLQKIALLGAVFLAVLGAARLVPVRAHSRLGLAAGVAAGLVYGWSPYVAERLLIGHWSLLLGFGALPWIARAALLLRAGAPGAWPRLILALGLAALTPTGALLALGVVLALAGRRALAAGGCAVVLALPWILAGALSPSAGVSDPAGVAAFATRGEGWGGPLLAALGAGGIWNAAAVPGGRSSVLIPVVTIVLTALAGYGWFAGGGVRGPLRGLLPLGLVGVLLACAGSIPGVAALLEVAVRTVPGAGLLRDEQKWTAWWALVLAVGVGLAVPLLAERARRLGAVAAVTVVVAVLLLPVAALPDLAWGVGGRLQPVAYPPDWQRVRTVLAADSHPGDVLVLPFGAYRAFGWNGYRPQLDPAPRWLTRPTITDDTLVVSGRVVAGEDRRARDVGAAAGDPARLAALGVGWVLVERGTPGRAVPAEVLALPRVLHGSELDLYRVPGVAPAPAPALVRVILVVVAHACALGLVAGAALWIFVRASTLALRRRSLRKWVPA